MYQALGHTCPHEAHVAVQVDDEPDVYRDVGSLMESPAAGQSEVLLLESYDGGHLNPTQSRFSRFASGDSDPSSAFGVTSRVFKTSSAGYSLKPGYSESTLQQAIAALDHLPEPSHVTSESYVSQNQNTVLSGHYRQQQLTDQHVTAKSMSGSAGSYQFQEREGEAEMSSRHRHIADHSQTGSVANTDGRTRLSSSARWAQQPDSPGNTPEAASSVYDNPNVTGFPIIRQEVSQESPHRVSSDANVKTFSLSGQGANDVSPGHASMSDGMQGSEDIAESEAADYRWSVQSRSYAGSPGHDSLHSWTDCTPVRGLAEKDPASPDARTILRSIARECQHAVEGKSPVVRDDISGVSPQNRPDLSRTPNTFFNPSFDADEMSKSP